MKDKVLKLCRRLKSCTLSDLSAFIEIDEKIIETILLYLRRLNSKSKRINYYRRNKEKEK